MDSQEYWRSRETEAKKYNIREEAEYNQRIQEIYASMMDEINKEINGFYTRYAEKEGITMAEAKRRVDKLDIAAYERKAKKYVATKDFSDQANEEMRIYNLTMRVNRLELLKANIGLETVSGFDEMQKYFDKKLTERTLREFRRQAGILGKSVLANEKYAHAIVNASFKNATYSDRKSVICMRRLGYIDNPRQQKSQENHFIRISDNFSILNNSGKMKEKFCARATWNSRILKNTGS